MPSLTSPWHEHDLPVAMVLVDDDDLVASAEVGVWAVLGSEVNACEGRSVHDLLPHPLLGQGLERVRSGRTKRCQLRVVTEGPPSQQLLVTLTRFEGPPARVAVLMVMAEDWRSEGEQRAARQFRTTLEAVIGGFAHEVRNPLAAILSLTEAAQLVLSEGGKEADELLGRVPPLVARVDKLIKQSLSYSRPRIPQRVRRSLRALAEWSIELSRLSSGDVQLEVAVDERLGPVLVDADQIEQVLVHMLHNARDAARRTVRLSSRPDETSPKRSVWLDVSDDGEGIEEGMFRRVFEPFFTTKDTGTGLGLAIARHLARLNGGDLILRASSPAGTCFSLLLEVAPDAPAADL